MCGIGHLARDNVSIILHLALSLARSMALGATAGPALLHFMLQTVEVFVMVHQQASDGHHNTQHQEDATKDAIQKWSLYRIHVSVY